MLSLWVLLENLLEVRLEILHYSYLFGLSCKWTLFTTGNSDQCDQTTGQSKAFSAKFRFQLLEEFFSHLNQDILVQDYQLVRYYLPYFTHYILTVTPLWDRKTIKFNLQVNLPWQDATVLELGMIRAINFNLSVEQGNVVLRKHGTQICMSYT